MNNKEQIIETVDENGNQICFELIDIVEVDNIEYALLLPVDENDEAVHEEEEIVIMRLKKDGEDYSFELIEDDDEFEKVSDYIETLENDIDE